MVPKIRRQFRNGSVHHLLGEWNKPGIAVFLLLPFTLLLLQLGCSRDANTKKLKYLESGQRYYDHGKFQEAFIQFSNAIQVDEGYAEAHYHLAQSCIRLQKWATANAELRRTIELEPNNVNPRIDLANLLIAGGALKEAKEQTDFLFGLEPNNAMVHVAVADLLAAQGDLLSAASELQRAIALAPSRWESYLALAQLQVRLNQPAAAERSFRKAAEMNVNTADAALALANYYSQTGNFAPAEQEITDSVRLHPNNPELRAALVRVYMSEGKEPEAESAAKEARDRFSENSSGYRMLGDLYFAAGDYGKALAEYESLYRKHSADLQVRKNLIQVLIINHDLERAQKLNAEILKARPNDSDALDDDAQIDLQRGDAQRAIKTLQSAIPSNSENALLYYHLGTALDQTGSSAEADRCWRKAVRLRPDLMQAQLALAKSAMRDGDMPALEQAASELVRLLPALPDGYAMRAFSQTKQGHLAQAEKDAEKAISVSPGSAQGYIQMGNLRASEKREDDALQFYREALDRAPSSAEALNGLVNVYLGQNQAVKALSAIEEQISRAPQSSAFYDLLGSTRFEHRRNSGDLQKSEAELRKSTELDAQNADAWLKLGQIEATRGAVDDAITTSKQALQRNPKQVAFYLLIGRLYERKGELERARQSYQQALTIDSANPQACNAMAHLLAQTGGNLDLALSLAQTAHRALPDAATVSDTMGWVLYQQGAYKSAIALFREALKAAEKSKSSDDPTLHYHLALAYAKDRQQSSASRELERALKTDPSLPGAGEVRKLLEQVHE